MSSPDVLFPSKPSPQLRIYAWSPKYPPAGYEGLIKIGQTTKQNVNDRIRESQGQMQQAYTLHIDEPAERNDGSIIRDTDVIRRLVAKGFENPHFGSAREWVRTTPEAVLSAITELRSGKALSHHRYQSFAMRPEQEAAVRKTLTYYRSIWEEDPTATPRFLWNAKMRFGKHLRLTSSLSACAQSGFLSQHSNQPCRMLGRRISNPTLILKDGSIAMRRRHEAS